MSANYARYISSGYILFVRSDATLMRAPFDPEQVQWKGAPVAVIRNLCISGNGAGVFDVSTNASFIYVNGYVLGSGRELSNVVRINRYGQVSKLPIQADIFGREVSVSPDGKRILVSTWEGDLWLYDLERNTKIQALTKKFVWAEFPIWSPDGRAFAFLASPLEKPQNYNLYIQPVNGGDARGPLIEGIGEKQVYCWTPDGKSLIYVELTTNGPTLKIIDVESRKSRELADGARNASVSPDGKWIAYGSPQSGRFEVYVQPLNGSRSLIPISSGGGNSPAWSSDGKELYYQNGERFMVVHITTDPELRASFPQVLFEAKDIRGFDFVPRTGEFYALQRDASGIQTQLQLITNWLK
jgi:WD40 repeat protein